MKLYNTEKIHIIISVIAGLLLVSILAVPFAFLGFWWALLVDYVLCATLMFIFAYQSFKNNKEYDAAIDELLKQAQKQKEENVDKVF